MSPSRHAAAAFASLALSAAIVAQGTHPLAPRGVGAIVPAAHAQATGSFFSSRPLAWRPNRFQQVIAESELPSVLTFERLEFRQDDVAIGPFPGQTVELEIRIGYTSYDKNTLRTDFDNFDFGPPTVVKARGNVALPSLGANPSPHLDEFQIKIPLDTPFTFESFGNNLLIEVVNYGNGQGGFPFNYPVDSGSSTESGMLIGDGPTATAGLLLSGSGVAMRLGTEPDHAAAWDPRFLGAAAGGAAIPVLEGITPPLLGAGAGVQLMAPGMDLGILAISAGLTPDLVFPVSGFGMPVYTDPAAMIATPLLNLVNGVTYTEVFVPNAPQFLGMDVVWQGFALNSQNVSQIGASNALLANLGTSVFGVAVFALTVGPRSIASLEYWKNSAGNREWIHCASSGSSDKIQVSGSKTVNRGPLQIRLLDANGNELTSSRVSVPASQENFSNTLTVPAGYYVHLYNADTQNSMNVSYEVDVVK